MDRALLVVVQELDRILDGQDVIGAALVDQVDDRRERRRLAGTGRAGRRARCRSSASRNRQSPAAAQLRDRRNLLRDDAHHDREGAALAEDVDAEPAAIGQRVRRSHAPLSFNVRSTISLSRIRSRASAAVSSARRSELGDRDRRQFAESLNLRRPPGRKDQVADAVAGIEHLLNQTPAWQSRAPRTDPNSSAFSSATSDAARVFHSAR